MTTDLPFLWVVPDTARLEDMRSGRGLSASQLRAAVRARAHALAQAGVGQGHLAAVAQADPLAWLTDLFACWAVGARAVAVNPALPAPERVNVTQALGVDLWLDGVAVGPRDGAGAQVACGADDPALLMTTSGTTGQPKGVTLSLRAVEARVLLNLAQMPPEQLSTTLCPLPVFFGHGLIGNILTPLATGARVLLWPAPGVAELPALADALTAERVRFLSSVPAFWQMLMRVAPPLTHGALARVHVGSAPLSAQLWGEIAAWAGTDNVWNMFGMTEAANWISGARLADPLIEGAIGAPWGGRFAVLTGRGVAPSGHGELLLRGPALMQGYWNDPARTAEAWADGWFRTGDIADLAEDGTAILRGRQKFEINRAGVKVLAEEVDMLLARHPDVSEALAVGLPDAVAGELVGAAVVLRAGRDTTPAGLIGWCRSQARPEAVPTKLVLCDTLPRTDRGKPDRNALRAQLMQEQP